MAKSDSGLLGQIASLAMIALSVMVMGGPAQAEIASGGQQDAELTQLADERAIERLLAEYIWRLDAQDFEAYGQLFENGVILDPQGKVVARGAAEVAAVVKRYLGGKPNLFVRHVTSSPVIDIDAGTGTATARSFMTTIHAPKGQPAYIFRVARYYDRFVKKDGRWQFASRQELTDWILKEHPTPVAGSQSRTK